MGEINRGYVPNHKVWDEIGRITPIVEYSESHRPHIGRQPAPWLPVIRYEEENKGWYVVSNGKVVAEALDGYLTPAGLKKGWNTATTTTVLSYTANDVAEKTTDLTTGSAVTAAVSYTEAEVTAALRERGLIRHGERCMDFISMPVGIAPYNYYQAAGPDNYNPRTQNFHNYRLQANCAIVCDYVATYPVLPALATTEATADRTGGGETDLQDIFDGTTTRDSSATGFFTSAQLAQVTRYASSVSSGDDVVAFVTVNYPVAVDTTESQIACSTDGCLVREVDSISAIRAAGDYFWDYEVGVLFLYEAGGDAVPSPWVAGTTTLTYYHYQAEGSATNTPTTYACATGDLRYGDFLTYDAYSNIVKANLDIGTTMGYNASYALYSADPDYSTAADAAISLQLEQAVNYHMSGIIGQVVGVEVFGEGRFSNDYLDRVRTVHHGYTDPTMRTPGTATGGRSDALTYAHGAEKMVIVNLIMR